jgi:hypothetical protein
MALFFYLQPILRPIKGNCGPELRGFAVTSQIFWASRKTITYNQVFYPLILNI